MTFEEAKTEIIKMSCMEAVSRGMATDLKSRLVHDVAFNVLEDVIRILDSVEVKDGRQV